jgi:23S rRNA (pseudouridine1915-N3)-methyltransferase
MVHINILCVGKIKEKFFQSAINEYSKRLSRFCSLSIAEISDEKIPDKCNDSVENAIKEKEGNRILSSLKQDSYVIGLDLTGKEFDSISFSKYLDNIYSNINSNITFIIGGSLGLSKDVINRCNSLVCFSKMTFPHQLIRIFLLEQIYRSFKILSNETYHK